MSPAAKYLIGFIAIVLLGWLYEGPLGNGERYVNRLEASAKLVVADTEVPNITASAQRRPLARAVTLAGPADRFQRDGQGVQPGLTEFVQEIPGMAAVRWADEPGSGGFVLPLLVETWILVSLAYAVGLGLAWFVWKRPRGYSD